jgi:hypothetical protein
VALGWPDREPGGRFPRGLQTGRASKCGYLPETALAPFRPPVGPAAGDRIPVPIVLAIGTALSALAVIFQVLIPNPASVLAPPLLCRRVGRRQRARLHFMSSSPQLPTPFVTWCTCKALVYNGFVADIALNPLAVCVTGVESQGKLYVDEVRAPASSPDQGSVLRKTGERGWGVVPGLRSHHTH